MDSFGDFLGAGLAATSGGLFGLIGNVTSKLFGFFERKQDLAAKREEWAHQISLLRLQMDQKAAEATQSLALASAQGSWAGLKASLDADAAVSGSYAWVNAVRALVRPILTAGLMLLLGAVFFALPPGDAERADVIHSLIFAACTAAAWWFGDRSNPRAQR